MNCSKYTFTKWNFTRVPIVLHKRCLWCLWQISCLPFSTHFQFRSTRLCGCKSSWSEVRVSSVLVWWQLWRQASEQLSNHWLLICWPGGHLIINWEHPAHWITCNIWIIPDQIVSDCKSPYYWSNHQLRTSCLVGKEVQPLNTIICHFCKTSTSHPGSHLSNGVARWSLISCQSSWGWQQPLSVQSSDIKPLLLSAPVTSLQAFKLR